MQREDAEAYVSAHHRRLLRSAYLLTGRREAAEDLAQETAVRVLVAWPKVSRADDREAYVRRTMLHLYLSGRRRAWTTREVPAAHLEAAATRPAYDVVDDRDQVLQALRTLPPRQRAAVVLRHYEQLSEAETAAALGCSTGNIKSLTSRGLASLRALLSEESLHD